MFYLSYLRYELKKWLRDSLTAFMAFYPLILGLAGRYLVPFAEQQAGVTFEPYYHIILVALVLLTTRIVGSAAAFSILDDRDDNILTTIKVAPLSLELFIGLKLLMVFVLGFVGSAFVLWFTDLVDLKLSVILGVSFLSALGGPLTALMINVFAQNKIEGFAAVKSLNVLVMFPLASLFFRDSKEFIFAFEPGFWPAKALSVAMLGDGAYQLNYASYFLVGLVYALIINVLVYKAFSKKIT